MERRDFIKNGFLAAAALGLAPLLNADAGEPQKGKKKVPGTRLREITGKDGMSMTLVPAGTFLMGSPEGEGNEDEHPRHEVYLDAYYIDRYPVTVAQYRRFCEETGARFFSSPRWGWRDKQPLVRISWEEAAAYARHYGKRLPTEAEWEKACRAGTGTKFSFGNDESLLGKYACYKGNSGGIPCPVGQKKPNGWNIYDMHGGVWEWCSDWYGKDYYGKSPGRNPQGPDSGIYRVLRGGRWKSGPNYCRSALRMQNTLPPGRWADNGVGFRCVMPAR